MAQLQDVAFVQSIAEGNNPVVCKALLQELQDEIVKEREMVEVGVA